MLGLCVCVYCFLFMFVCLFFSMRNLCQLFFSMQNLSVVDIAVFPCFNFPQLFGLIPRASLFDLEAAGQHYCEDDWDKQKNQHNIIDDSELLKYCFSSAYMVALLHDSLGIPMDEKRYVLFALAGVVVILICVLYATVRSGKLIEKMLQIVSYRAILFAVVAHVFK